jgi:predicted RNA-binding Zn ribbon-like protein
MDLTGGDVSLDFVNTAGGRDYGSFQEKLRTYADLVTWAERVGVAGEERGRRLRAVAARLPAEAEAVLARAQALREALFRLFSGRPNDATDLDLVADEAGRAASEQRLVATSDGYEHAWPESERLEQLLWPVALSAADLLTSEDRPRIKECAAADCNWLFLDVSRNRSRRWCDMRVCGNRAKARRFTARRKGRRG